MTRKAKEIDISAIQAQYLAGDSFGTLAARFDVSEGTIRNRLLAIGVALRTTGQQKQINAHRKLDALGVVEKYTQGASLQELCETTGFSYCCLKGYLRKKGIQIRDRITAINLHWRSRKDPDFSTKERIDKNITYYCCHRDAKGNVIKRFQFYGVHNLKGDIQHGRSTQENHNNPRQVR